MIDDVYLFLLSDDRNRASGNKRVRVFTAAGNGHFEIP
jgi:hypothetical protein